MSRQTQSTYTGNYQRQAKKQYAVFSAKSQFNPTSLAVEDGIQNIFDQHLTLITQELRLYTCEDNE